MQYLTGRNDISWRDVDTYQPLIAGLFECKQFRFEVASHVKEGVMAALIGMKQKE